MLSDFFDTMGTVIGIGGEAGWLERNGRLPRLNRVLLVDSLAAVVGGAAGASSATTYIESAAGVSAGARTGLTSVFTGLCFLLALFFSPLAAIVPAQATAPALVIVGFLMVVIVREIRFSDIEDGFPALLTLTVMPFTYSITNGIGAGFVSYCFIKLVRGKGPTVHPMMWTAAVAFVVYAIHFAKRQPSVGRTATTVLLLGALAHTFVIGMQTMEVRHVPISNTSTAVSSFVWMLALSYLYIEVTTDERAMGVFIVPILVGLQTIPAINPGIDSRDPVLDSPWFWAHVTTLLFAYATFALAAMLGLIYMLQFKEIKKKHLGYFYTRLPSLHVLDAMNSRAVVGAGPTPLVSLLNSSALRANHTFGVLKMTSGAERSGMTTSRSSVSSVPVPSPSIDKRRSILPGGAWNRTMPPLPGAASSVGTLPR